jgi:hypothetical protein
VSATSARDRADRVFAEYIKDRDRGCRRCFTEHDLECAHILPRHYLIIRCDPDNAMALCHRCHRWFTEHPDAWRTFVEFRHAGRFAVLREKAQSMVTPDWAELVTEIRALHQQLRERREQPGPFRSDGR